MRQGFDAWGGDVLHDDHRSLGPRFEGYRISRGTEEFQCPACGCPLYAGDTAVEDLWHGECYCCRSCAKADERRRQRRRVTGWGDVRRILREDGE